MRRTALLEIFPGVIHRMVHADLPQEILFGRSGRAENLKLPRARQLHYRNADAARGAVNQDAVAWLEIAHLEHGVVSGQVVDRDSCSFSEGNVVGEAEDQMSGHRDALGIGAEHSERDDAGAGREVGSWRLSAG